jgi:hypothetical protein
MIDPITISAVIGGAKALKAAFDTAKEAMDEFRECAEAGMSATESMGALVKVFTAHGEVQKHINEVKKARDEPVPVTEDGSPAEPAAKKSATVRALEAMQYERELRAQEEELKNYLTWQCNEPGLYAELCYRRDVIVNEEKAEIEAKRRAETERILEEKRKLMAIRRERAKKIESLQQFGAAIVIGACLIGFVYAIWWMFQQGGKL